MFIETFITDKKI